MATQYHRLARESTDFRHWRLPVAFVIILVAFSALAGVVITTLFTSWLIAGGDDLFLEVSEDRLLRMEDPDTLAANLLLLATLIPAIGIGVFAVWPRHVGYLHSVAGRLRWRYLWHAVGICLLVLGTGFALTFALTEVLEPGQFASPQFDGINFFMLLIVLLFTPLQAAAEEYLFRGYLLQLVASWTRFLIIPAIVTTVLFVLGHGYGFWGQVDVAVFAIAALYLTIRTGGLEAAIAYHVVNNVLLLGLGAFGVIGNDPEDEGTLFGALSTVVLSVILCWLLAKHADRLGLARTRPIQPALPDRRQLPPTGPYGGGHAGAALYPAAQHPVAPAPARPTGPPPQQRKPRIHPNAPDYPGELGDDWN